MVQNTASDKPLNPNETVNTGGGAFVAKSVHLDSGDFVGRDQLIYGNVIIGIPIKDIEYLPPEAGNPPYQGLHYFEEKDADWFFGRERMTVALVNRLHQTNFLAVVGDSGSGKSSIVRAGIIPAMKGNKPLSDGSVPPLGDWQVKIMTPTAQPLDKLAVTLFPDDKGEQVAVRGRLPNNSNALNEALTQVATEKRPLLLVVDQFEELFSQCKDEQQREAFIANLVTASQPTCKIILTLRADFYAPCLRYEPLRRVLKEGQEPLGPMTREELRAAILGPAAKGDWQVQEGLAEEILDDVGQEPGTLPLLSHALHETWERRRGRVMTLSGYRAAGGVKGAIAQTAEAVYQDLTPNEQSLAQQIFLRLTELGEGTQDTRRRLAWAELQDDPLTAQLIKKLAHKDARLIITTENGLEVAHEALIREWPRLRDWLDENREGLRLHRQLTEEAQAWQANDGEASYLYRGGRLTQAQEWAATNNSALNALEQRFLTASQTAATQEANEREAQRQRELAQAQQLAEAQGQRAKAIRQALIGVSIVLVLAVAAAIFGFVQSGRATDSANLSATREVEARIAQVEAVAAQRTTEAESNARATQQAIAIENTNLAATREAVAIMAQRETDRQRQVALAQSVAALSSVELQRKNDTELATLLAIEGVRLNWDSNGGAEWLVDRSLRSLLSTHLYFNNTLDSHQGWTRSVAFSPDGHMLASGSGSLGSEDYTIRLWNMNDPTAAPTLLTGHEGTIWSVAFSPDGHTLASGSDDGTIRLWDVSDPASVPLLLTGHESSIYSVAFSPDGHTLASGSDDRTIRLWNLDETSTAPTMLIGHEGSVYSVAFSPDGHTLASGSGDALSGTIRLWDLSDLTALPTLITGYKGPVHSVAFSPNGSTLASGNINLLSEDVTIRLWDLSDLAAPATLITNYKGWVNLVTFSPDGRTLASVSNDQVIRLWDLDDLATDPTLLTGHEDSVHSLAFSPDGHILASGSGGPLSENGIIRLWDMGDPAAAPKMLIGHENVVSSVIFSPNGRTLASGSSDRTIGLRDIGDPPATLKLLTGHEGGVNSVAFSPNGNFLASGSNDRTIRLWDMKDPTAAPTLLTDHENVVNSVVFSPDGRTLASGSSDRTIRLWNMEDPTAAPTLLTDHENVVNSVVFSPDGRTLASGSSDRTIRLWNMEDPTAAPTLLTGHEDSVLSIAFSPDGRTLASGSSDRTIRLWNMEDPTAAPMLLTGHEDSVLSIAFSPDGRTLASGSSDRTIRLWPILEEWDMDDPAAAPTLLTGHASGVRSVAFSLDGHTLASGSGDRTIRLWVFLEELVEIGCQKVRRNLSWAEWQRYLPGEPYRQTCPNLPVHPSVPAEQR